MDVWNKLGLWIIGLALFVLLTVTVAINLFPNQVNAVTNFIAEKMDMLGLFEEDTTAETNQDIIEGQTEYRLQRIAESFDTECKGIGKGELCFVKMTGISSQQKLKIANRQADAVLMIYIGDEDNYEADAKNIETTATFPLNHRVCAIEEFNEISNGFVGIPYYLTELQNGKPLGEKDVINIYQTDPKIMRLYMYIKEADDAYMGFSSGDIQLLRVYDLGTDVSSKFAEPLSTFPIYKERQTEALCFIANTENNRVNIKKYLKSGAV